MKKVKLKHEDNVKRTLFLADWLLTAMEQGLLPKFCTLAQAMELLDKDTWFIKEDTKKNASAKTWKKSWK